MHVSCVSYVVQCKENWYTSTVLVEFLEGWLVHLHISSLFSLPPSLSLPFHIHTLYWIFPQAHTNNLHKPHLDRFSLSWLTQCCFREDANCFKFEHSDASRRKQTAQSSKYDATATSSELLICDSICKLKDTQKIQEIFLLINIQLIHNKGFC